MAQWQPYEIGLKKQFDLRFSEKGIAHFPLQNSFRPDMR
jgi:hypothetical protein